MSTMLPLGPEPAPELVDADPPPAKVAKRVWVSAVVLGVVAFAIGGGVLFAWMVNETHFDRPSQEFDELESRLEKIPGVASVEKERWVEAPTFSDPTSWMSVAVDEAGLPALLQTACSPDYPDAVTWSILVRTPGNAEVLLHAAPPPADSGAAELRCPDFGFDAVGLVQELDRVAPGLAVQPTIWEDGTFTLVALAEEVRTGYNHLLPLIEHADELLIAAGLGIDEAVEINAASLGLVLEPGEGDQYVGLLSELGEVRAVSSFWADGGGTPVDGIEKVQIVAPDAQHAAIEAAIRSSGLHIADLPVRFIEQ